ncbi:MAG: protein phosphatase 2C domain-containing protein [Bacteroidota bacterium]
MVQQLLAPKAGHRLDEYEDAATTSPGGTWPLRLAVADGATETAFAGAWARHLTQAWVMEDGLATTPEAVTTWQHRWHATQPTRQHGLPWYAVAKAEQGAFAALLGAEIHADGTWGAWAVGDCNLMVLRAGAWHLTWPFSTPEAFTATPALLSSRPDASVPPAQTIAGTWSPGDTFVLATDALAAFLLAAPPPPTLTTWTEADFQRVTEAARTQRTLRNDDVTLLITTMPA